MNILEKKLSKLNLLPRQCQINWGGTPSRIPRRIKGFAVVALMALGSMPLIGAGKLSTLFFLR